MQRGKMTDWFNIKYVYAFYYIIIITVHLFTKCTYFSFYHELFYKDLYKDNNRYNFPINEIVINCFIHSITFTCQAFLFSVIKQKEKDNDNDKDKDTIRTKPGSGSEESQDDDDEVSTDEFFLPADFHENREADLRKALMVDFRSRFSLPVLY